jgi:hypothetical protein
LDAASTPRLDRCDISDQRDSEESTEPADSHEPIEKNDSAEPTLPMEANDPTLPMDRTEPVEAIDSTLSSDHSDHREDPWEGTAAAPGEGTAGDAGELGLVIPAAWQASPDLKIAAYSVSLPAVSTKLTESYRSLTAWRTTTALRGYAGVSSV